MKSMDALRIMAEITASQWGMLTAAQASKRGVTRLTMSRLSDAGHLERLAHGVYRDAGAPSDEFEDLRAAWLSTEPQLLAEERLSNLADGVVVASASAAQLYGVGDLWANRHEFVTSKRRQTQRSEIRYRQRQLESRDVTLVEGLPTMTLERLLADLLDDVGELSIVADALGSAEKKRALDRERLRELFGPFAERHGFKRDSGNAVLEHLLEAAGLDLNSVARRIAANAVLSSRVLANYLQPVVQEMSHLSVIMEQMQPVLSAASENASKEALDAIRRHLATDETLPKIIANTVILDSTKHLAELIAESALRKIPDSWAQSFAANTAAIAALDAGTERQKSGG